MSIMINQEKFLDFVKKHKNDTDEEKQKQLFYNDLFDVFGVCFQQYATFEYSVKNEHGNTSFVDVFYPRVLLVEHKSASFTNLEPAIKQAESYYERIKQVDEVKLPKYILVSNFKKFILINKEDNDKRYEFSFEELTSKKKIHLLEFIGGSELQNIESQKILSQKASYLLGNLFDELVKNKNNVENLKLFLVRILFCMYAEDSGIMDICKFSLFIKNETKQDGSDTGEKLSHLFTTLNKSIENRPRTDDLFNTFPYVNGGLFADNLEIPVFTKKARDLLLKCCDYDWNQVSPIIFGSLFEAVVSKKQRAELGEHFTSEANILKTLKPLFLDNLEKEFEKCSNKNQYKSFLEKISNIKILDPACGCGNFLVVAYSELRKLELKCLDKIFEPEKNLVLNFDAKTYRKVNIDNFYGIEIESFPCEIAKVAMWLIENKCDRELSNKFGQYIADIPLKHTVNITCGNALTIDWNSVISNQQLSYIVGNPPFIGARRKNQTQSNEMKMIFSNIHGVGNLDYVCAWYKKCADYIHNTNISCALVSTSSITQGQQPSILWSALPNLHINFAYKSFIWKNEGANQAAVYCIILGFSEKNEVNKYIFDNNGCDRVKNISPNLTSNANIVVNARTNPIIDTIPRAVFGSMPNDGGNLLLTKQEKKDIIEQYPHCEKYIKPLMTAKYFINKGEQYCLWLKDIPVSEYSNIPPIKQRIENVRVHRLSSNRQATKRLAETPMLFGEIRQPDTNYILIPSVSSENRQYMQIAFLPKDTITNNSCIIVPTNDLFLFGILNSKLHNIWKDKIGGKLKQDYRYSIQNVYNTFPFPKNVSSEQKKLVISCVENILAIRKQFANSSMAELYGKFMQPELLKAHQALDKAVERIYTRKTFKDDSERLEFLLNLYQEYVSE